MRRAHDVLARLAADKYTNLFYHKLITFFFSIRPITSRPGRAERCSGGPWRDMLGKLTRPSQTRFAPAAETNIYILTVV